MHISQRSQISCNIVPTNLTYISISAKTQQNERRFRCKQHVPKSYTYFSTVNAIGQGADIYFCLIIIGPKIRSHGYQAWNLLVQMKQKASLPYTLPIRSLRLQRYAMQQNFSQLNALNSTKLLLKKKKTFFFI